MRVKVCDAICGAGKTSASIRMMNESIDKRYIFVTQYLSEVDRIKDSCEEREFVSPEVDEESGATKLMDINRLVSEGVNIATTHSLFVSYTDETKDLIRAQGYTLVLDEVVDVLCCSDISASDLNILIKSGSLHEEGDLIRWSNDDYGGSEKDRFREEMLRAKSSNFLKWDNVHYFWAIPPELFTCFKEVYVLTYMFNVQPLRSFFDIYGIEYELIGTKRTDDGFEFCPMEEMDRRRDLRHLLEILDNKKLNQIGDKRTSLSFSWYKKNNAKAVSEELDQVRKNLSNLYKNIWSVPSAKTMWTTFKESRDVLAGKGYIKSFVPYNKRASNEYADRRYLAYCVNNFPRPWEVKYYREHGSAVDADGYAVSILIQWIFRSAIRNGEKVWLYLPSVRMRSLLTQWLDNLAEGNDLAPVSYKTPRKSYYKPVSDKKSKR